MSKRLLIIAGSLALFGAASLWIQVLAPRIKYTMPDARYNFVGRIIFDEAGPIDTVFMGSSRIRTAVNATTLRQRRPNEVTYNLAITHQGRSSQYLVLRDLLLQRSVSRVVLQADVEEVTEHETFAYLAGPGDLLDTTAFASLGIAEVLTISPEFVAATESWLTLAGRVTLRGSLGAARALVFSGRFDVLPDFTEPSGFESREHSPNKTRRVYEALAAEAIEVREVVVEDQNDRWLRAIRELCDAHGVSLRLLFVPIRDGRVPGDETRAWLEAVAPLTWWDPSALMDARLWTDRNHLNRAGAAEFTRTLLDSELY